MRLLSLLLLLSACTTEKDTDTIDVATDPDTVPDTVIDTDVDTVDDTEIPDDTDVVIVGTGSELVQPGVRACGDLVPRETALFEEKEIEYSGAPRLYLEGSGSALADFTGDGLKDVMAVTHGEILLIRQSNAGTWEPGLVLSEPNTTPFTGFFGASAIDVDDDGDFDVMITARGLPNHLLINDGSGNFTDGTAAANIIEPPEHHSTASSWSDWDGDGDLDLLVAGHGWVDEAGEVAGFVPADPTLMYENQGDGTFERRDDLLSDTANAGYTFVGGWLDADGDGDDDLYLSNDFGVRQTPGNILWNDGGRFRHDADGTGLQANLDANVAAMGIALGDFDGDGLEDIGLPAWNVNKLYTRRGGIWFESAQSMGWVPDETRSVGWGAEFVDVDSDGLLDLTTAYGYLDTVFGGDNWELQPDAMWVQRNGVFEERSNLGSFNDNAPHRSINTADMNGDGWPDFVKIGMHGKGRLYLSNCGTDSWATFTLRQPAPNIHAVGATVRIFSGDRQWMRRIRAGGTGYGTGTAPEMVFGLGELETADRVEVHWPDGESDTWENVPMRQHFRVNRP